MTTTIATTTATTTPAANNAQFAPELLTAARALLEEAAAQLQADKYPKLLRLPEVLAILPISRGAWYKGIAEKKYPKALKAEGASMWPEDEVLEVLARMYAARDAAIAEEARHAA